MVEEDFTRKIDKLIDKIDENIDKLDNIETLLIGDVQATEKIGILERLRLVEKWIEKREWFEKLVFVAVVGNAIGLIFVLVQNALGR